MTRTVAIIGHVAKDVKEGSKDGEEATWEYVPGGGSFYGAVALARVLVGTDINVLVVTKGRKEDESLFLGPLTAAGVKDIRWIPSEATTTFRNVYIDNDPSRRVSTVLARATPFTAEDLEGIEAEWTIISPLWSGEFPEELIKHAASVPALGKIAADIQGFTRMIDAEGHVTQVRWERISECAPALSLLKADDRETSLQIGGPDDWEEGAKALSLAGCRIICTCAKGVLLANGGEVECSTLFGSYNVSGRTGRGDTVTSSFVACLVRGADPTTSLLRAGQVTTFKMQSPGPLKALPVGEEGWEWL